MTEESMMGGPDEPELGQQDSPNDSQNDNDWLDELGKEPTKITDERDSSEDERSEGEGKQIENDIPEWFAGDLEQDIPEGDAVPDWLRDEISEAEGKFADKTGSVEDQGDIEETAVFGQAPKLSEEDVPEWLRDAVQDEDSAKAAGQEKDDLSWLDQIAAGEGAAIEEPPTLSWEEDEPTAEKIDPVDEDMAWLDDMSTLPAITAEELASRSVEEWPPERDQETEEPLKQPSVEGEIEEIVAALSSSDEDLKDLHQAVPEDPDEAMAWLERLAAKQGAPSEELPSITEDRITMMAELDDGEMPEDPDEAMAWLERLAAEQEVPDEDLVLTLQELEQETEPETKGLSTHEEISIEGIVEEVEKSTSEGELDTVMPGLEAVEMPEDLDEALSWLEELVADEEPSPVADKEPVVDEESIDLFVEGEIQEIAQEEIVLEESDELVRDGEGDFIDAPVETMGDKPMEEDEDAMAWLEKLAARQGAPLEEMTTPDSELDEVEAPEWLRQEMDEALKEVSDIEPEGAEGTVEEIREGELEIELDEADRQLEPEPSSDTELVEIFGEEEVIEQESIPEKPFAELEGESVLEELFEAGSDTGALDPSTLEEAKKEDLDWMESLGTVDVDGWLEAEVDATAPNLVIPAIARGTADVGDAADKGSDSKELEVETIEEPEVESDLLLGDIDGFLDGQRLEAARGAIEAGNLDTALYEYEALLNHGQGLPYLIVELQNSITNYGDQPRLQRLLGDAYAQNGQLRKAVEVYRQALDNL